MTNKQHLAVILGIIIAISLLWRMVVEFTKEDEIALETRKTSYSIEIASASLGLNCRKSSIRNAQPSEGFLEEDQSAIRKDNALHAISAICKGQEKCVVPVSLNLIDGGGQGLCSYTKLEVEYRCFNFDRPWTASAYQGSNLVIDCTTR